MNLPKLNLSLFDWLALMLSLAAVLAVYLVADRIFERIPHLEDEMAYVWQAQAIAGGDLVLPSPPNSQSFLVPFVIDHNGFRFGKYPPGWPAALGMGVATGLRDWVNPSLAGLGLWLLYLLAKRITSAPVGLLAVLLMLSSPMFWILSGSLLSHPWSLVLASGFILAWLDLFKHEGHEDRRVLPFGLRPVSPWMIVLVAGLSLGVLVLTRPMGAVGVALPFFIHGLVLLARGDRSTRLHVLAIGLIAAAVGTMLFAWQFAVTGDPLRNPYTLWWDYDKVGFGPGHGRWEDGHTLEHALHNMAHSLRAPDGAGGDILGWEDLWCIFLPFGLWSLRKKVSAWLVAGIFPGLLLVYSLYWIGSWQYGPRYYYVGMLSITIISAAGVAWLAGGGTRIRKTLAGLALALLVGYNLFAYLPPRLVEMQDMYGINRAMLEPFTTTAARDLTPALILVHVQREWTEYGGLLDLQNAQLSSPFIFATYRPDAVIADYEANFPDRQIYHYYPDEPFRFYQDPR